MLEQLYQDRKQAIEDEKLIVKEAIEAKRKAELAVKNAKLGKDQASRKIAEEAVAVANEKIKQAKMAKQALIQLEERIKDLENSKEYKAETAKQAEEKVEKKEEPQKILKEDPKPVFSLKEEEPLNAKDISKDKNKKIVKRRKGRKRYKFLLPLILVVLISSIVIFYLESDFANPLKGINQDEMLQDEEKNNLKENDIQEIIPTEKVEEKSNTQKNQEFSKGKEPEQIKVDSQNSEEAKEENKEQEKASEKKPHKPVETGAAERSKKNETVTKSEVKHESKANKPEIKEKQVTSKPLEKASSPPSKSSGDLTGKIIISCAAVSSTDAAKKSVDNLKNNGLTAGSFFLPDYQNNAKPLYKIFVGPFNDRVEAQSKLDVVKKFYPEAYVQGLTKK